MLDSHLTSAHEAESKRACGLTARELQILRLIVHGKPGKDIADLLGISINTVSSHRTRIGRTLGCSNSAQLVAYAIRKGLVAIPWAGQQLVASPIIDKRAGKKVTLAGMGRDSSIKLTSQQATQWRQYPSHPREWVPVDPESSQRVPPKLLDPLNPSDRWIAGSYLWAYGLPPYP